MKCLNDSGLKKLMIFLESRVPGITKIIQVDGNKLSIDKNIKLYAFVEDVVTEANETVIPSNAPPLTAQNAVQQNPNAAAAASQKERIEQQREKIEKQKEEKELEDRLDELEQGQFENEQGMNLLRQTNVKPVINTPDTPKRAQQKVLAHKDKVNVFQRVADVLGGSSSI